jgi:glycosyltransferase involved in cell wall biosynthesis
MREMEENGTQVSVVMPVFNGEKYVAEAVDSILRQSFKDFEFVILNDGSEDCTSKILATYEDARILVIERENRGFAHSLNEAIQLSKGRYIARMDADDIALENRLELQYEFMESNPGIDILGGQAYTIDEDGRITGEMRKPISWDSISKYIRYACPLCHPTYFLRRNVYAITKGYRLIPPVEDYDFLLRAFEKGFIMANLPEKVLKHRIVSSGMSLSNPGRTVVFASRIQKLHKMRTGGKREDEILLMLQNYNKKTSLWFRLIYNARNKLLNIRKNQKGFPKYLFLVLIIFVSLGDYHLFLNTYNGFRSLRWNS